MEAYKLLRLRRDGTLGPLFINARQRIPVGQWLEAEDVPTKGFAHRPGWHAVAGKPEANHLSTKGRVWCRVDVEEFYRFPRPKQQGGEWLIARRMRVVEIMGEIQ